MLVEKYTSTSSCKHCIVDQNIILKSKTRDLYLFSLYTICLWTQKDSPIPPQQISVPSNLSAELAYLCSSRYAKSLSPFVPNIPSNLFTTPFSSTPSSSAAFAEIQYGCKCHSLFVQFPFVQDTSAKALFSDFLSRK